MYKEIQIRLTPEQAANDMACKKEISNVMEVSVSSITAFRPIKRSIDARKRQIMIQMTCGVWIDEEPEPLTLHLPGYKDVRNAPSVVVVGAGPGGLFAALRLVELGLRPIVVERGKDVSTRKVDLAQLQRTHIVDPESNYAFGEGGAGTYSDGKLYTRSTKRGDVRKVFEVFVHHGASEEILVDTHPHIGTDKLPYVIKSMRETDRKSVV